MRLCTCVVQERHKPQEITPSGRRLREHRLRVLRISRIAWTPLPFCLLTTDDPSIPLNVIINSFVRAIRQTNEALEWNFSIRTSNFSLFFFYPRRDIKIVEGRVREEIRRLKVCVIGKAIRMGNDIARKKSGVEGSRILVEKQFTSLRCRPISDFPVGRHQISQSGNKVFGSIVAGALLRFFLQRTEPELSLYR